MNSISFGWPVKV